LFVISIISRFYDLRHQTMAVRHTLYLLMLVVKLFACVFSLVVHLM